MAGQFDIGGTLSATGSAQGYELQGRFDVEIDGLTSTFVGTAFLEKSYDNGVTYKACTLPDAATPAQWSSFSAAINVVVDEPAKGVLYRVRCTRTSGTLAWRFVQ
jgi:hypothetical protein